MASVSELDVVGEAMRLLLEMMEETSQGGLWQHSKQQGSFLRQKLLPVGGLWESSNTLPVGMMQPSKSGNQCQFIITI